MHFIHQATQSAYTLQQFSTFRVHKDMHSWKEGSTFLLSSQLPKPQSQSDSDPQSPDPTSDSFRHSHEVHLLDSSSSGYPKTWSLTGGLEIPLLKPTAKTSTTKGHNYGLLFTLMKDRAEHSQWSPLRHSLKLKAKTWPTSKLRPSDPKSEALPHRPSSHTMRMFNSSSQSSCYAAYSQILDHKGTLIRLFFGFVLFYFF